MNVDVAILGGGVAGLGVARRLRHLRPGLRICVVDRGPLPADRFRSKVGESATESSSGWLADTLGLRAHLDAEHVRKAGLRFWLTGGTSFGGRPEWGLLQPFSPAWSAPFDGTNPPTWQLHRGRLEHFLAAELSESGVVLRGNAVCSVTRGAPHALRFEGGESWTATWLVDAAGGGLPAERVSLPHTGHGAWFWVPTSVDVDRFSDEPEFRGAVPRGTRWHSTNHLVGDGRWLWVIRLGDGSTSIGLVSDPKRYRPTSLDETLALIARLEPECAAAIFDAGDPFGFAARGWTAFRRETLLDDDRVLAVGDAAAFLDPMYSSGLDLMVIAAELGLPLLLADLDGQPTALQRRRTNGVFARIVEQYLGLYIGVFDVLGHPKAFSKKVEWDLATYFGFLARVVRSGALSDGAAMAELAPYGARVAALQAAMGPAFVAASRRSGGEVMGRLDQGRLPVLGPLLERLRSPGVLVHDLAMSVAEIEALCATMWPEVGVGPAPARGRVQR